MYVCSRMVIIKDAIRQAWDNPPENCAYDFYATTLIEVTNDEISKYVTLITESHQYIDFISTAISTIEGICRADVSGILASRLSLSRSQGVGICLIDIVRDILAEIIVQDMAKEGLKRGFFKRTPEGHINITPEYVVKDEPQLFNEKSSV